MAQPSSPIAPQVSTSPIAFLRRDYPHQVQGLGCNEPSQPHRGTPSDIHLCRYHIPLPHRRQHPKPKLLGQKKNREPSRMLFPTIRNVPAAAFSRVARSGSPRNPPWKTRTVHSDRADAFYNDERDRKVQYGAKKNAVPPGAEAPGDTDALSDAAQRRTVQDRAWPRSWRPALCRGTADSIGP